MTEGQFPTRDDPRELDYEYSIFDRTNPRSLINIVWRDFREVMERVEREAEDILQMNESGLRRKVDPDMIEKMLRMRFWQEYDRCQEVGCNLLQRDVTRGIIVPERWSRSICTDNAKVVYIITPPPLYQAKMETALDMSVDALVNVLQQPDMKKVYNKAGEVVGEEFDTKLAALKLAIHQSLDQRVKGAIMKKIAIHSKIDQRTQITDGTADMFDRMDLTDLKQIESAMHKVQKRIAAAQSKDVLLIEPKKESLPEIEPELP